MDNFCSMAKFITFAFALQRYKKNLAKVGGIAQLVSST